MLHAILALSFTRRTRVLLAGLVGLWMALAVPVAATEHAKVAAGSAGTRHYTLSSLAGQYSFGNGLNQNFELTIAEDGTFSYEQATYEGPIAQAAGTVAIRGGKLVLSPDTATVEAWPAGMGLQLVPVAWGERQYLVPDKDIMMFVNAVNRGNEPVRQVSRGNFFLREGDLDKPAPGKPDLPERESALILKKPVNGRVLAMDHGMWKVDIGRASGMCPGMELCCWSPADNSCVTLVVSSVQDNCCYVECKEAKPQQPLLNWKVCSRARYE